MFTSGIFECIGQEKEFILLQLMNILQTRDAEWMGQVHRFLGLNCWLCHLQIWIMMTKKAAYDCDITYITNNELRI